MRHLRKPFQIVRADLRLYLVLNTIMYGLLIIGAVAAAISPELTAGRLTSMDQDGTTDLVVSLLSNPWLFALTIFAVNVFTVGLLSIVLPSMLLPFAGIGVFGYRAVTIGMTLAPQDETTWLTLIPHSLTILIEFQAYLLLCLGATILGRAWLRPLTVEASSRGQAYARGLQQLGWLGSLALALFVVGAVYEAFSLRYLVPLLLGAA